MKAAWVTGASGGLGRSVAAALSTKGYSLGLGCLHTSPPELPDSTILRGNLADPETSRRSVSTILERFGRLDLFVANAGIAGNGLLAGASEEEWNLVLSSNLSSVFYSLRAAAKSLCSARGSVIIVSSHLARHGGRGSSMYAASKSALMGLALSAARELAPEVNVNVVIPGYMETEMGRTSPRAMERARAGNLTARLVDIEAAADFIISVAENRSVSGQVLVCDGRVGSWT